MRSSPSVAAAVAWAFGSTFALAEAPAGPAPVNQVGVDVIRIDAAVTDEEGRPVRDLRPEDFRLKVDGKPVPVENVAFFGENVAFSGKTAAADGIGPDLATDTVPGSSRDRSIVFLIDDLNLSRDGVAWTRDALKVFAADWEALDATIGVRFTSDEGDKVLLSRNRERFDSALDRFRYRQPNELNPFQQDATFRRRIYSILTTLNALRSAPGRKAVILVSDGFDVGESSLDQFGIRSPFDALFEARNTDAALRTIVEVANRASTVVHAVHPAGTVAPWPRGSMGTPAVSQGVALWPGATEAVAFVNASNSRPLGPEVSEQLGGMVIRQGLQSLASETGGLAFFRRNGIERGLFEIAEDQRSYYLVGFQPPKATFSKSGSRANFHRIELTVDRPRVRVRTRAGFYGVTDDEVLVQAPLSAAITPIPLQKP